LILLRLMGF